MSKPRFLAHIDWEIGNRKSEVGSGKWEVGMQAMPMPIRSYLAPDRLGVSQGGFQIRTSAFPFCPSLEV